MSNKKYRQSLKIKPTITFTGAIEGKNQERLYFNRLETLIKQEGDSKYYVKFNFSKSIYGGSPLYIVEKVVNTICICDMKNNKQEKRLVAVFDYDNKECEFKEAIKLSEKEQIIPAYSNFCFDLWLLFHKIYTTKTINSANGYDIDIRKAYSITDEDLKSEEVLLKIINSLTLTDIKTAIKHAEKLETFNKENGQVLLNGKELHYNQPTLYIHNFIKDVLERCELL